MGLLHLALGLSWTKGESPKDSYNTKLRENAGDSNFNYYLFHIEIYFCFPKTMK